MDTSFSLSIELIYLMNWLLKHEKAQLKSIINNALKNGLLDEINQLNSNIDDNEIDEEEADPTELHTTILDFLIYLEDTLIENLDKKSSETENLNNIDLNPELRKINSSKIDTQILLMSIRQAKNLYLKQMDKKKIEPEKTVPDIKNVLHSQLIKNWKPGSNDPVN